MLKFVKDHLQNLEGIAVYPLVSLFIFLGFFILLFVWVFSLNKEHIQQLKEMPLASQPTPPDL